MNIKSVWRTHTATGSVAAALVAAGLGAAFATSAARADAPAQVPADVVAALNDTYAITLDRASEPASVTANQALDVAREQFGWAGGGPAVPYLVSFTDHHHGPTGPDGAIVPDWVNKKVWMVVIPDTTNFILGPNPSRAIAPNGNLPRPKHRHTHRHGRRAAAHTTTRQVARVSLAHARRYIAKLCVFIDADTGQMLEAATVEPALVP